MKNKPLCLIPWTNIDINPRGYISPCCKIKYKVESEDRLEYDNLERNSISEYARNPILLDIKDKLSKGEWPDECERCRVDEENGIPSKRQLDYERRPEAYDNWNEGDGLITVSIAFDNVCNLKCIMCSPMASSKWREEYNLIYSTNYENVKEYQSDYIQDLIDSSPNVLHFDIHGGEPFLSKATDQKRLLQHYVSTGKSKHIDLHYITNATIFPDDEWWELWDNFKSVEIQLSLDAHGLRYNYIRFPGEWHSVLPNIELYLYAEKHRDNITLSVSHTVSAYNIYYLDCFYNWCINIGLPKPYLGRVNKPTHMQPEVWSEEAKEAIKEKLLQSKHPEVKQWSSVMERDTGLFEEFKYYMRKHDEYRKLSFCEYFPELACYVT